MIVDELSRRAEFLTELDKLKSILRASPLTDQSRRENSAEHSWHLAMYALVLAEYADEPVDLPRVINMLLVHDIVEIDAGDHPIHLVADGVMNAEEKNSQVQKEQRAAERLFGLLPDTQAAALHGLWLEFEAADSADARFAKALDRLQPLLQNIAVGGGTWRDAALTRSQVVARYGPVISAGSAALWRHAEQLIDEHFAIVG